MAYCRNCGNQINDKAVICPYCGVYQQDSSDTGSFCWSLFGCCFPIIGLILWLLWKDTRPRNAKSTIKGALVGTVISFMFYLLSALLGFSSMMMFNTMRL